MGRTSIVVAIALTVSLVEPARARADVAPEEAAESREAPPSDPRPVPDYDGRPPPPPRPDERAAWVPRVLFYPMYALAEYVVRRPFGFLLRHLDPERVLHFFRLGEREKFTLAPTFSYDFGFRPNIGLLFRARDLGVPGHSISAYGAFGGKRWYAGRITQRYSPASSPATYELMVEAMSRPDGLFVGIGGDVTNDFRARYHWVGTEVALGAHVRLAEHVRSLFRTGHRFRQFDDDVGSRISIEERVAQGAPYGLPPGYVDGYSIWFAGTRLELDTRSPRPAPGSGVRLSLMGNAAVDVRDGPSSLSFFVYGASVGGYVDLTGLNHALALTATAVFSDAVRGEIPFTELPTLAGDGPLEGFLRPYLIADSGAALSLSYTWPIWVFLDGKLDVALGNGFDGHLDGFSPGRLRLSSTIGIAAFRERAHFLQLAFGIGTDELEDGPDVEQVRFVIGATQEF